MAGEENSEFTKQTKRMEDSSDYVMPSLGLDSVESKSANAGLTFEFKEPEQGTDGLRRPGWNDGSPCSEEEAASLEASFRAASAGCQGAPITLQVTPRFAGSPRSVKGSDTWIAHTVTTGQDGILTVHQTEEKDGRLVAVTVFQLAGPSGSTESDDPHTEAEDSDDTEARLDYTTD